MWGHHRPDCQPPVGSEKSKWTWRTWILNSSAFPYGGHRAYYGRHAHFEQGGSNSGEQPGSPKRRGPDAASELVSILLDSDVIFFLVGTRVNEAHQDPNLPVELDIRRNIIKKITSLLEEKYLKETEKRFI